MKIGIVGVGYVGKALCHLFLQKGNEVVAVDVLPNKLESLRREIPASSFEAQILRTTTRIADIGDVDAILVCVPTPLDDAGEPDLSLVEQVYSELGSTARVGSVVILESTVAPGTTRRLSEVFVKRGLEIGEDIFIGFSSERIDPDGDTTPLDQIPKVLSGMTEACLEKVASVYGSVFQQIELAQSMESAELSKLIENTYRLVNIALMHQVRDRSIEKGVDFYDALRLAATKPFGFQKFVPALGAGGHCIPVDPGYLDRWLSPDGSPSLIGASLEINKNGPLVAAERLLNFSRERGILPSDARILVLGASYKRNSSDTRQSATLRLAEILQTHFLVVDVFDPLVPDRAGVLRELPQSASYDIALLTQAHEIFGKLDNVPARFKVKAVPSEGFGDWQSLF